MSTATLRNARDAFVTEANPTRNTSNNAKMYITGSGSSNTRFVYLFFTRPFPLGVTVLDAHLRVWNGNPGWSGSHTVTAKRITSAWAINRINWNNKPTVTTSGQSALTKSNTAANLMWDFPITTIMQAIADGGAWYGIRLEISTTLLTTWFHSTQSGNAAARPQLVVTWSDAPEAPDNLSPGGNRQISVTFPVLSFQFTDVSGDTSMAAAQFQIDDASDFTSVVYDSGEVPLTEPSFITDSTDPGYVTPPGGNWGGITAGQTRYWRARAKDGAGIWSQWSDPESFGRTDKNAVTITAPAASPNNTVSDNSPPIAWTFGGTQRKYQVALALTATPGVWLWTSGVVSSTQQSLTIPSGYIKDASQSYRLIVRVWDAVDREANNGVPIYSEATRDFTFVTSGTVSPVASLQFTDGFPYPYAQLTWTRAAGVPDFVAIERDGVIIARVPGVEVFTSGTSYLYKDKTTPPRQSHTWKVYNIVNNVSSSSNPTVTGTIKPITSWLMEVDGDNAVALFSKKIDMERQSETAKWDPKGQGVPPVLITQSIRGFEGHASGQLSNNIIPSLTARQQRDRFKAMILYPGVELLLYNFDEVMKVVVYNASYYPIAVEGDTEYIVDFDFFQTEF